MPINNLLEYSDNYYMRGNLWNYYRDEVNDDANENKTAGDYRVNNKKATTSRSLSRIQK